jgi:hypothetical protein
MPQPGAVVRICGGHIGLGLVVRVIRVNILGSTPDGWGWLQAYVLNERGNHVERRELFVPLDGLIPVKARPAPQPRRPVLPMQPLPARPVTTTRRTS